MFLNILKSKPNWEYFYKAHMENNNQFTKFWNKMISTFYNVCQF